MVATVPPKMVSGMIRPLHPAAKERVELESLNQHFLAACPAAKGVKAIPGKGGIFLAACPAAKSRTA